VPLLTLCGERDEPVALLTISLGDERAILFFQGLRRCDG
jgi:hypothetical protein